MPLAAIVRSEMLESTHLGSVAAVDEDGRLLAMCGGPLRRTFLRSAAKPFQLTPFVARGGAERYGLTGPELALAAASHSGERVHTNLALRMLQKGGFEVSSLHCGGHPPMYEEAARELIRNGEEPNPLHNNCSGKHAAMLLACNMAGEDPAPYYRADHPLQGRILDYLARISGLAREKIGIGVDGCSVPVFRMPLYNLALAYSRLFSTSFEGETRAESEAHQRVARAMTSHPFMVAGTGRFTTQIMEIFSGQLIAKEGADGVYALSLSPGLAAPLTGGKALGVALKIEDGGERCRDLVTVEILEKLGLLDEAHRSRLDAIVSRDVLNVRGDVIGKKVPCFEMEILGVRLAHG